MRTRGRWTCWSGPRSMSSSSGKDPTVLLLYFYSSSCLSTKYFSAIFWHFIIALLSSSDSLRCPSCSRPSWVSSTWGKADSGKGSNEKGGGGYSCIWFKSIYLLLMRWGEGVVWRIRIRGIRIISLDPDPYQMIRIRIQLKPLKT